jgi:hypothetical protein
VRPDALETDPSTRLAAFLSRFSPKTVALAKKGKVLPYPKGILQGTATKVRYIVIESIADLDHEDVQSLFKAAIEHSGLEFPRTGSNRMIIKSDSKKKGKKSKRT